MISTRLIGARNLILRLGFGDGLGQWLSSEHLPLSEDGLGLGFWLMTLE